MSDRWTESTEGDLDPDLSEEAPYSAWDVAWDAPSRGWVRPAIQAFAALGLIALLGGALLTLLAR
ncbi:MAG: hypothetical protein FJ037_09390 [Chloroflexi bacterium]|nr:hypothetical protein [Chloroflexota bacterium]